MPLTHFLKTRTQSMRYALHGLMYVISTQHNAKVHLGISAMIILLALALQVTRKDWCWLICCIALVWFAETINTAFEYVCDVVSPEYHQRVEKAKDIAAGAVLICAMFAAVLGTIIFTPYLSLFISHLNF